MTGSWETVVGLEVHTELLTESKLFCGCRNKFGEEPNTNVCPVCLGLPGSMPVLNKVAVELAMRIGVALHCTVGRSIFHRKNYFYPDMPKDYQISQYDLPINTDGWLELPNGTCIGIERAHMEEDTGKTWHQGATGRIQGADYSLVDYNRAGVPLVEIVSRPDIRSAEDAKSSVEELRGVLLATGASDGRMEEGSLRVDANVSIRREGSNDLGTRCEIKNMNSLRSLGRAIVHEAARQVELVESGGAVVQETRHWNESTGTTSSMRSKEEAFDYRYFPEPDLVPVEPSEAWLDSVKARMPALPADRRRAVSGWSGLPASSDAVSTVVRLELDPLVKATEEAGADSALAVRRLANEVASEVGSIGNLDAGAFVRLVGMEAGGELTPAQSRTVLRELLDKGGDPASIAGDLGFEALGEGALDDLVQQVITSNPAEWDRYSSGEDRLLGFFVGKIKAESGGSADLKAATQMLRSRRG